jgi:hypothetical protein
MTADLHLVIAHHLLFLLLAGVLAFEIGVVRSSMDREDILRVARVEIWYGVLAGAIILVGFSRAIFAAKGWAYYSVNLFFWAAAVAGCGIISLTAWNIEDELCSGTLVPILTDWQCGGAAPLIAIYRKTRPMLPQVSLFVQYLAEAFQRYNLPAR